MIQKEALESVDQHSPGFCSWLFLVEKVTGEWRPVIDLSTLNGFVTLMKFKMETVVSVSGSIRNGDWLFSIDLKDSYFQIPVHLESRPYLRLCLKRQAYQFCALCFGLFMAPQVFTSLHSGFGVGAPEGRVPSFLPGRLASHCGVEDTSAASGSGSPVVQGSVDHCQLEEVRPPAVHSCPVSEMLITSLEVFPLQARLARFWNAAPFFSPASVAPSTQGAAGVGPHGFTGTFSSSRSLTDASFAMEPQGSLVLHGGQPGCSDPFVTGVRRGSSLVAPGGQVGVRCPSLGSSSIPIAAYQHVSA